jgi:hypothetical protein
MEENRDFKLKIDDIEKRILIVENNKNQNEHSLSEHAIITELMERQSKSNNIILFNLPEKKNLKD